MRPIPQTIVWTRNATEAINLVAYSWGRRNIGRGDVIVLTEMEHHANLVPWQILAQEKDADLEFIPITDDGILRQDVFDVLLRLKPKLVAFTHVSNTLGTINPVEEMTRKAHEAGALVLVDGAQAVPHLPVDVAAIGCDFYTFSGHKALAPTGSGVLWGRRDLLEAMPPFMGGGDMIREVHLRRSEWNDVPWKFEAGTPDISAQIGLGVAADYLLALGMDRLRDHERELVTYALEMLPREVPGIEIYGPPAGLRGGVVPFNIPGVHPHDVAQVLDRYGVAIRAGHHCTMPLHERLDLGATARASFQAYTSKADIDALRRLGGPALFGLRSGARSSAVERRPRHRPARGPAAVRRLGPRRYTRGKPWTTSTATTSSSTTGGPTTSGCWSRRPRRSRGRTRCAATGSPCSSPWRTAS